MHQEVVKGLVVFLTGLIVKIHGLGHLHSLVVSPKHQHFFRVLELKGHKEDHAFDSHRSPVDVVSQEEKVLFRLLLERGEETDDFEEVVELSVNITDADDRLLDEYDIGLILLMEERVLAMLMNRSQRCFSHDLGSFFSSESNCLRSMMLILLSFPNCYSRLFIMLYLTNRLYQPSSLK